MERSLNIIAVLYNDVCPSFNKDFKIYNTFQTEDYDNSIIGNNYDFVYNGNKYNGKIVNKHIEIKEEIIDGKINSYYGVAYIFIELSNNNNIIIELDNNGNKIINPQNLNNINTKL